MRRQNHVGRGQLARAAAEIMKYRFTHSPYAIIGQTGGSKPRHIDALFIVGLLFRHRRVRPGAGFLYRHLLEVIAAMKIAGEDEAMVAALNESRSAVLPIEESCK